MKKLLDFKEEIHKCSKCGLCQAECPIYQATGNDCTVSRGQFVMLNGVVKGDLKMSKAINRYLDLCLKCGKCSKFCPSGIDVVDVIVSAKSEYFNSHFIERFITIFQKYFLVGLLPRIARTFIRPTKSKKFDKKVVYFGGCKTKLSGDNSIVKILNSIKIEVINPEFHCCGVPYFVRGDLKEFKKSIKNYTNLLEKQGVTEVITTCASCEKSLKDYIKWADEEDVKFLKNVKVKNIYEYLRENNLRLKVKKTERVTYHKPCNINNFDDIEWVLTNTKNLDYVRMQNYDNCCGFNGLTKINEYGIMSKIFRQKREDIVGTRAKIVLTSCLGCELALKLYSLGRYKVYDAIEYLGILADKG